MFISVKSFKSQTDKSKNGGDVHPERHLPFVGVSLYSGRKMLKFGTTTPIVDGDLFEAKPLAHVAAPPTLTIDADKQKKNFSKVKSMKKSITKLFKPTGRLSAAVLCVDHSLLDVECSATNDYSSLTSPPILQDAKSSAAYCENVADERIEDLASTFRSIDESSSSSSASWFSMATKSQLDISHLTFDLGELPTIDEEDGSTREVVGVINTQQEKLANSYSGITVYLSIDTLFDHSTQGGSGLVSSESRRSPAGTSLATSVDKEDSYQFLPDASHRLRRVLSYEDLKSLQVVRNYDLSCSAMSCGFSDCDCPARPSSSITAVPLRRSKKCDNLRESFLSLEPKPCISSPCRTSKYKKLRVWLSTRCDESSKDKEKMSVSPSPKEPLKLPRGCQFLQGISRPSSRVRAYVLKPPPHQSFQTTLSPVWPCAKITRSRSKAKERRRITKRSMKEWKARLGSMDIDPWY